MNPQEDGTKARVLAAAWRTWSTTDTDNTPHVARITIRQPPNWGHATTIGITDRQYKRVLGFLRDDLIENRPGYSTPERAAHIIRGLIIEHRAAGHTRLTTADLVDAAARIGRSRAWIANHITDLVYSGQLQETRRPSVFRIA